MPNQQISLPAGYAPAFAIGFAGDGGELAIVESAKPLPITFANAGPVPVESVPPSAPAALAGQASASTDAGPFAPVSGRPVILQLSGSWTGTVRVLRSVDAGATRHALTVSGLPWGEFTGNACEPVWAEEEAGAELYLDIAMSAGTVEYRLSQ